MAGEISEAKKGPTPPGGASTFDIFSWSTGPDEVRQCGTPSRISMTTESNSYADPNTYDSPVARPAVRMQQPGGGNSTITFGQQMTSEESDAICNRRPFSDSKRREMTGSRIFERENSTGVLGFSSNGIYTPDQSSIQCNQQAAGKANKISFGVDGNVLPKKATTLAEMAKQKELSRSESESTHDEHTRRQFSDAKAREFFGNDIFGPPSELPQKHSNCNSGELREHPTPVKDVKEQSQGKELALRNVRTSVKVSNPAGGRSQIILGQDNLVKSSRRGHDQKVAELSGSNIFKGEHLSNSGEKLASVAKLREMSGSDIFSDGKAAGRDSVGGIRKPPGGESSLSLV